MADAAGAARRSLKPRTGLPRIPGMRSPRRARTAEGVSMSRPEPEHRTAYHYFRRITTRWMDNDVYGHVNNVVYYSYFDTVVNTFLVNEAGLNIETGPVIGLCVESHCRFLTSVAFPDLLDAGLRVAKLGRSSVKYE